MLSVEQLAKKDPKFAALTPEEQIKVHKKLYELGKLMLDDWLDNDGSSKIPERVLQQFKEDRKIKPWPQTEKNQ